MPKRPQRKIIGARLVKLMAERQLRKATVAGELGVSPSQIKRWINEEQGAMPDAVRAMANYFDVSEAYLYGLDTADIREQLALEVSRALGSPEADVIRAFGALSDQRRHQMAGWVLGRIEAEVSAPLTDRQSVTSHSMIRRDGASAPRAATAAGARLPASPASSDGRNRSSKP